MVSLWWYCPIFITFIRPMKEKQALHKRFWIKDWFDRPWQIWQIKRVNRFNNLKANQYSLPLFFSGIQMVYCLGSNSRFSLTMFVKDDKRIVWNDSLTRVWVIFSLQISQVPCWGFITSFLVENRQYQEIEDQSDQSPERHWPTLTSKFYIIFIFQMYKSVSKSFHSRLYTLALMYLNKYKN